MKIGSRGGVQGTIGTVWGRPGKQGGSRAAGVDFWMHSGGHEDANGSDMGAKWEPNAVKMLINIVAKFAMDLGGHFGVQKVSKGLPKGRKTGGQIEAKSLQEATCAEKAETVKIALAPLREH